jgi:hypothetical protein
VLILFIIIQGPKGEGMINSMNGARSDTHTHTHHTTPPARHHAEKAPFLRHLIAIILRALSLPLTPARARAESRMFGNFSETKNFVSVGTWGLVLGFLLLSAIVAIKH